LESASSGGIDIGGQRVDSAPPRNRNVAFVFQNYALYPHMTVAENLGFSLRLQGIARTEIQARVTEVARLLEIEQQLQHKPQQLSGGQRQRVALGRAIVRRPQLFLFDEPLSNLDATLRAAMRVELARLHERLRATMLYVTHDQAEAMTLGEKIVVLHRGALQQIGTPADIYHRPSNTFVAAFVGHPQMNLFEGQLDASGTFLETEKRRLDLSNLFVPNRTAYSGARVTLGIRPEDFHLSSATDAWISGSADFVEDLGSDCFVHLSAGDLELVARLPAHHPIKRGDRLNLTIDFPRAHLFHEGRRVESGVPGP
jgi:multiple sugar transport system ATP-binding protein